MVGWSGCEKRAFDRRPLRLCDLIDLTLIEHLPSTDYDGLRRVNEVLTIRSHRAHLSPTALPETAEGFVEWVCEEHRRLFAGLIPAISGVLRTEKIYFGRAGRHEREGSNPSEIIVHLHRVFEKYVNVRSSPASRTMAVFLQAFFEVHPFADGNGRIGRLFVAAIAQSRGLQFVHSHEHDDESRYIEALERAHAGCAKYSGVRVGSSFSGDARRPLALLEEYIDSHLAPLDKDSEEEIPPL